MRPKSIERFEKVYLGAIAIGLVEVAIGWQDLIADSRAQLPAASEGAILVILVVSVVLFFGISLLLWFSVARRAHNVAKWVLVLLIAGDIYSVFKDIAVSTVSMNLGFALNMVSTLLGLYAVWLMFRPDSVAWLEGKDADGQDDPTTFD